MKLSGKLWISIVKYDFHQRRRIISEMTLLPEVKTLLVIKAVAFFPVLFGDFVKIISQRTTTSRF